MPALTIPSPTTIHTAWPAQTSAAPLSTEFARALSRPHSPDRPPVSPITPTISPAQLAPVEPPQPPRQDHAPPIPRATFMRQPPAVPISESDNPDAIALRSAISLLQLQREKSKRDLKTLQELKNAAISDPHGLARSLQDQRNQLLSSNADVLGPTLSAGPGLELGGSDGNTGAGRTANERKDSASAESPVSSESTKFPPIPQPQNIVRCPPINWAKYHIVGEPLDKMHEEQRRWPGSSEPPRTHQGNRAPPHAVASPYSPFTDSLSDTSTTQQPRATKKSPS